MKTNAKIRFGLCKLTACATINSIFPRTTLTIWPRSIEPTSKEPNLKRSCKASVKLRTSKDLHILEFIESFHLFDFMFFEF